MSKPTRGIFQILAKHFIKSFRSKPVAKLIGEDHFGTKYFEEPKDSSKARTRGRFFEPKDQEAFDQELPAEWEAWLRYRRREPPTWEEIEENCRIILMKRENAAKLEMQYLEAKEKTEFSTKIPRPHAETTFPVYKEYIQSGEKKNENK